VNQADITYLQLMIRVLGDGRERQDRTGTGTISLFGEKATFDLTKGFPLLTTKKVNLKNIWTELLWFLKGDTNIAFLKEHNNPIWDAWADEEGELGPVYGEMWNNWPKPDGTTLNQMRQLIDGLRKNPFSRRHIVSGWNPALLPDEGVSHAENVKAGKQALPPCHTLFQFYVEELTLEERVDYAQRNRAEFNHLTSPTMTNEEALDLAQVPKYGLSCQLYQRSGDLFLGVPYNIASYALLTFLVAELVGMIPWRFHHTFGDVHIYSNHLEQVREQLGRCPMPLPHLDIATWVRGYEYLDELQIGDIELIGYESHPFIKAPVAV